MTLHTGCPERLRRATAGAAWAWVVAWAASTTTTVAEYTGRHPRRGHLRRAKSKQLVYPGHRPRTSSRTSRRRTRRSWAKASDKLFKDFLHRDRKPRSSAVARRRQSGGPLGPLGAAATGLETPGRCAAVDWVVTVDPPREPRAGPLPDARPRLRDRPPPLSGASGPGSVAGTPRCAGVAAVGPARRAVIDPRQGGLLRPVPLRHRATRSDPSSLLAA